MTDTPATKGFLNAVHDAVQWCLHVLLILPLAILKALDSGIQHLITELSKV